MDDRSSCLHVWGLIDDENDVGVDGRPTIRRCQRCEHAEYNPMGYIAKRPQARESFDAPCAMTAFSLAMIVGWALWRFFE